MEYGSPLTRDKRRGPASNSNITVLVLILLTENISIVLQTNQKPVPMILVFPILLSSWAKVE